VTLMLMVLAGKRYYPVDVTRRCRFTIALLISTASILSIGFVIASIVPTARFAQPIGASSSIRCSAVGLFVPVAAMPPGLQAVARVLPLTYAVSLLQGIWKGRAWSAHLGDRRRAGGGLPRQPRAVGQGVSLGVALRSEPWWRPMIANGFTRLRSATFVVAISITAGCGRGVRVPCEGVQALRIGDVRAGRRRRAGPAVGRIVEDNSRSSVRQDVDVLLEYTHPDSYDHVRLRAEFSRGRLVYVVSYRRPFFRDQLEYLFRLDRDGVPHQGRDFAKRSVRHEG
jgi:ABC-2 type transport system permease protein